MRGFTVLCAACVVLAIKVMPDMPSLTRFSSAINLPSVDHFYKCFLQFWPRKFLVF